MEDGLRVEVGGHLPGLPAPWAPCEAKDIARAGLVPLGSKNAAWILRHVRGEGCLSQWRLMVFVFEQGAGRYAKPEQRGSTQAQGPNLSPGPH